MHDFFFFNKTLGMKRTIFFGNVYNEMLRVTVA